MTSSQAVYCLSLQIRPPTSDKSPTTNQSPAAGKPPQLQQIQQQPTKQPPKSVIVVDAKSNGVNFNAGTTITRNAVRSNQRVITAKQYSGPSHSAAAVSQSSSSSITTNSRSQQVVAIREVIANNSTTTTTAMAKHNQTMIPISQVVQTQPNTVTATISTSPSGSGAIQPHSLLQQQLGLQSNHHGNIILVRGSRNENGQIILQNSHELLSLLNDSEDKPILLQNSRFRASNSGTSSKLLHHQHSEGTILLQPGTTLKTTGSLDSGTVLLQSATVKKSNSLPEGSIIVQQRVNKNAGSSSGGGNDSGPILLQTLKRLDKSQSILVFRNSGSSSSTATATTVSAGAGTSGRLKSLIVSASSLDDDGDKKELAKVVVATPPPASRSIHTPLGADGEPIKLPDNLESLPRADHFPTQRHRWNTNEEIAAILISFDKHSEWQSKEVRTRPKSGSMLLYSRKKVRYRRDGYCWKKRKDGKTTREDHMKLKVQGTECIYGCYVHSAILPTFHRRCYWLLQNPDIVLVHYLNVPYPDDNKMAVITPSLALWGDKKEWTKDELISQLKPMFFSEDDPDASNEIELSKFQTAETVEVIVGQLMEKQRLARQAALVKQLECGCPDSTCADGKSCSHPMRRISAAKPTGSSASEKQRHHQQQQQQENNNNQVSSTTPNVMIGSRLYSRWVDRRGRDQLTEITNPSGSAPSTTNNSSSSAAPIHFQVIPSSANHHISNTSGRPVGHLSNVLASNSHGGASTTAVANQQQHLGQHQSMITINTSHASGQLNQSNLITMTTAPASSSQHQQQLQLQQQQHHQTSNAQIIERNNNAAVNHHNQLQSQQQQQQQQQHPHRTANIHSVNNQSRMGATGGGHSISNGVNIGTNNGVANTAASSAPPLVLNLSQIQSTNGGSLIILNNGQQQSFVCHQQQQQQQQQHQTQSQPQHIKSHQQQQQQRIKHNQHATSNPAAAKDDCIKPISANLVPKLEAGEPVTHTSATSHSKVITNTHTSSEDKQMHQTNSTTPSSSSVIVDHQSQQLVADNPNGMAVETNYESMSYSSTQQNTPVQSPSKSSGGIAKDIQDSFFNETLELSQEDIQKTLSANMPLTGSGDAIVVEPLGAEINPMDFINNCCDDVVGDVSVNNDDDVFVNLDAFDMFVEFPDLELDTKHGGFLHSAAITHNPSADFLSDTRLPSSGIADAKGDSGLQLVDGNENLLIGGDHQDLYTISDYSPEWSFTDGGVKVLVTGPWDASSQYTVLFDAFPVPTTVVQAGVLRCFCPAHEVGLATVQVACDGFVVSNSVIFEYKAPVNVETACEAGSTANESLYRLSLYSRLEAVDERMQIKSEPKDLPEEASMLGQSNCEERLVNYCHLLTSKQWRSMTPGTWVVAGHRGMTLLHLAAALGYSKLVGSLLTWRSENPNAILETEIDALSQDQQGYTPLMWSCARGHMEVAKILYKWNRNAINVKNRLQQTPFDMARTNGFGTLVIEIQRLESMRRKQPSGLDTSEFSTTSSILHHNYSSSLLSNLHSAGDDEHSFRRQLTNSNPMLGSNSYLDSSSVSMSLNGDLLQMGPNGGDGVNASGSDPDGCGGVEDTDCGSPLSIGSLGSLHSSRSHDGVFLRPGAAVSSSQSPPSNRLSKRSSVDSGISGMDGSRPSTRAGNPSREQKPKFLRSDRTLSLPVPNSSPPITHSCHTADSNDCFSLTVDSTMDGGSSTNAGTCSSSTSSQTSSSFHHHHNTQSLSHMSLLSPLRKMDFALCEVSTADASPMAEDMMEADVSDADDGADGQQGGGGGGDRMCVEGVPGAPGGSDGGTAGAVGESDAKVLTLAEQIIAAMPDHIKNESEDHLMSLGSPITDVLHSSDGCSAMAGLTDSFMEPLLDTLPSHNIDQEFCFEFSDQTYRYHDEGTPCSSLSPASSGPLQSPASYSVAHEATLGSPSPPPTTEDFTEFLHASASGCLVNPFESAFSNLTLTDSEQRELYEAAKCIQKAYRSYKGRKKLEEDKERSAAIVIQNYYRRYKQYAYYRQMTQAAMVIQNGYRSYCEHKRFKKSQYSNSGASSANDFNAAAVAANTSPSSHTDYTQNYYKSFDPNSSVSPVSSPSSSKEPSPSGPLKRTYSQRTQNNAARKIQQFMRQSKMKLQKERAEKERLAHQHPAEYPQNLPCPGPCAAPTAANVQK